MNNYAQNWIRLGSLGIVHRFPERAFDSLQVGIVAVGGQLDPMS